MKDESADTPGRRRLIDLRALMNAPDDCEIRVNAEENYGASESPTPWLRLMN